MVQAQSQVLTVIGDADVRGIPGTAWLDPERTPIRYAYWQRQEELRLDLTRHDGPDAATDES